MICIGSCRIQRRQRKMLNSALVCWTNTCWRALTWSEKELLWPISQSHATYSNCISWWAPRAKILGCVFCSVLLQSHACPNHSHIMHRDRLSIWFGCGWFDLTCCTLRNFIVSVYKVSYFASFRIKLILWRCLFTYVHLCKWNRTHRFCCFRVYLFIVYFVCVSYRSWNLNLGSHMLT